MSKFLKFKIVAILFATVMAFSSCKKESNSNPTPKPSPVNGGDNNGGDNGGEDNGGEDNGGEDNGGTTAPDTSGVDAEATFISIADVNAKDDGFITDNTKIKGVVISTTEGQNFFTWEAVIQEGDASIKVSFKADQQPYEAGDEIELILRGDSLQTEFKGAFRNIQLYHDTKAKKIGTAPIPEPIVITAAADVVKPENILKNVRIEGVTMAPAKGTVFNDGSDFFAVTNASVGSELFKLVVLKFATFAGETVPTTPTHVIGLNYGGLIFPRKKSDVIH